MTYTAGAPRPPILALGAMALAAGCLTSCGAGDTAGAGRDGSAAPQPPQASIAPADQFAENMSRCLQKAGWSVTVGSSNNVEASFPTAQQGQYTRAYELCEKEFGYDLPLPPMTDDEAAVAYADIVARAAFLAQEGFEVPEPPSKQASIEGLITGRDPRWDLDELIPAGADRVRAQEACPG